MKWCDFQVNQRNTINSQNISACQLFGCQYHDISLCINELGEVFTTESTIVLKLPQPIEQIVVSCTKDSETCCIYFRSQLDQVYEWKVYTSEQPLRKRVKLDKSMMERAIPERCIMIAEKVHHIMSYSKQGVLLFSNDVAQYYSSSDSIQEIAYFHPAFDSNITSLQYCNKVDVCFNSFFSLDLMRNGVVYGTNEGAIYWRNFDRDPIESIKVFVFEGSEKVVFIDLLCSSSLSADLNTLIAIGDQGTIILYWKDPSDKSGIGICFNQYNVQGPISSVDKAHKELSYLIVSGIGRISLLEFIFEANTKDLQLESIYMKSVDYKFKQARMCNKSKMTVDVLVNKGGVIEVANIKYNPDPISIVNNTEDMSLFIKDTLAELELSESIYKELEKEEQELSQKLASTNRTLYALKSINNKRKLGTANSLNSTGFEFSMRPIIRSESIANCSLHPTSYLRVSIKASRFLELEDWQLVLDLTPYRQDAITTRRTTAVMGFEPHYENGIEVCSLWERDIELDLENLSLPLNVNACLMMLTEDDKAPIAFPVAKMMVDDLHFSSPCNSDLITTIERRGLDEVTTRLMGSYHKQRTHDKTGKYPFAKLWNRQGWLENARSSLLSKYRKSSIKCLVDENLSEDMHRSILPSILNEGRKMDDMKAMFQSAEQATFTMSSYPGCPVMVKLSRASSNVVDIAIQCAYPPALFKAEASILIRLKENFITPLGEDQKKNDASFLKKFKLLEDSIMELQEKYQEDQMEIDGEQSTLEDVLKKSLDIMRSLHQEEPIGYLNFGN